MNNGKWWDVSWNPIDEKALLEPLQMEEDKRLLIEKDLFHPSVKDEWRDKVFAVVSRCDEHQFIIVTKHAKVMQDYFNTPNRRKKILEIAVDQYHRECYPNLQSVAGMGDYPFSWPYKNLHLYVQVENQEQTNERIPELLQTPAVVRGVLIEPMLGEVDLWGWLEPTDCCGSGDRYCGCRRDYPQDENMEPIALNSVILGGGTSPVELVWAREIRDQCDSAGVPFFFGGQLLDGKEHNDLPGVE